MQETVDISQVFAEEGVPREPQQARSRATRDAIFEAAAQLFEEKGYSGTNTKEIAARAEVGIGTLYFYFTDKRQLLLTMLADKISHYSRLGTVDVEAVKRDPRAYLRADLAAGFPYNRVYYGLVRSVGELEFQDKAFRRVTHQIVTALCQQMLGIIEAGREAGLTHPDLNEEETARTLAIVVYGFYNLLPSPSRVTEDEYWRRHAAAADMVYRAIFADKPPGDGSN